MAFLSPELRLDPFFKRDDVPFACEDAGRKVGSPAPVKFGIKLSQLLRIKIKMWQPRWDFCGVRGDGNVAPEHLKIDIGADLRNKVSPNDRVRIEPNVTLKRSLPHCGMLSARISAYEIPHFFRGKF